MIVEIIPQYAFTFKSFKNWWGPGPPGPLGDATPDLCTLALYNLSNWSNLRT